MDDAHKLPKKLIDEIHDVPPLPDVVVDVMRLTREPNTTAKQLTEIIAKDQGLTGNVLRLCNSAYYGLPRTVSSLNQAIMYLGFHTVRNLVLTCSIHNFYNPKSEIYGYQNGGLWIHVLACARVSDLISTKLRMDLKDTAYTAGLLHDIGQLIIGNQIEDTAETIVDMMLNGNMNELQAEEEVVGYTHCMLGAAVADKWNFPTELVHAIQYHHTPNQSVKNIILTDIVHLADSVVLAMGFGVALEQIKFSPQPGVLKTLGIDQAFVDTILVEAESIVKDELNMMLDL
ncbi:MAG: HDOD domain-containing protein [bacterium]|jgi:putative nucleotidyltransferase with HDIG domain|nr:HDOD domain-containing protein [bacterium]